MGLYRSAIRLGQVLGPILFGWIMVTMEIQKGIFYFGLAYLTVAILFICFGQSNTAVTATEG